MGKRINQLKKLNPFKDRSPVQRGHAADYMLITLISFAVSVSGTRLFLELTGYPQLGGGGLHIAHVLWGGLFLFAAAILPLIFLNEWILALSAVIAGFGIGLFIDEVGKFITETNDYFYPTAAPIIYVFFLLTVFLFFQIQKNRRASNRSKMYAVLEQFSEVLDQDLSADEFNDLMLKLDEVIQQKESIALVELAENLKKYLETNRTRVVPDDPTIFDRFRMWFLKFERQWLERKRHHRLINLGLLLWGGWALVSPVGFLLISRNAQQLQVFLDQLITNRLVRNASGLNWFEMRVLLEGSMGIIALVAALMLVFRSERTGVWIGIFDLLITLTVVNPLIFYFDQFSTIIIAAFQFILFVLLVRYQRRFLVEEKQDQVFLKEPAKKNTQTAKKKV